ncbi:MAG: N-acetylmuramoyl-L-alanine amidase [Epsilonproteobacteria bacterium]|nr:MAG: N-acetylmuramoyl-L-alanine amidase [Campylobacterota bacterium]
MKTIKNILFALSALFLLLGCFGSNVDRSQSLIVIDAGHGGHDSGAKSAGKQEKDLVLAITKNLYEEFKSEGYKVYLTRNSDEFLTLGQRTRIADKKDAKVFISIHANAVNNKSLYQEIEGIETYFLQKTRDEKSQRIAARENASVLQGTDQLSQDVIIDSVLNGPKIIQSHKLAIDVQEHIMKNLNDNYNNVKDGGVRPAPFYILVGASRPSILVEVGYITNPKERKRLFNTDYQEELAEGIVQGVGRYLDNRKREMGF